jgi:hypothetical protein
MSKRRKGMIKNAVLVSLMAFYFSCGKDVFPPESPADVSGYRNPRLVSSAMEDPNETRVFDIEPTADS